MLFFLTPITYPLTVVPEELHGIPLRRIFEMNPLTRFVETSRDLFYFGRLPSAFTVAYITIISIVCLFGGWAIFTRKARLVVEEL